MILVSGIDSKRTSSEALPATAFALTKDRSSHSTACVKGASPPLSHSARRLVDATLVQDHPSHTSGNVLREGDLGINRPQEELGLRLGEQAESRADRERGGWVALGDRSS